METIVRDYQMLGLRLGRLVDGFVDCWFGDAQVAHAVAVEPRPEPGDLVAQAVRAQQSLADCELTPERSAFLAAQLRALECAARRLDGEPMSFLVEVERYFGVPIALGDPDAYAEVHDEISALLPGPGPLQERVDAFYERNAVPPALLQRAVQTVSDELRALTGPMFGLPVAEQVTYDVVEGAPWNAFNRYLGNFRSSVSLNAEAGRTIAALPLLATHESYPGHHTEHCLKEAGLARGRGQAEHAIALVNTPQCLMAEGTAEHAVTAVLGPGWGSWTQDVLADVGVRIEGELVERMLGLIRRLLPARQDGAILLHDRGAAPEEVTEHLRRWLLLPGDRAEHMTQFLTDPLWRAYSVTYVEGSRLVGAWLGERSDGRTVAERYRMLLEEQLLPATLAAECAAA